MKKNILPAILIFSALLFSCDSEKKISKEVFEEVQQANEVKKLRDVDIINKAMEWGEEISKEAQEQLMQTLKTAIQEQSFPGAVEFCNIEALPILKQVGDQYGVIIRRASNDYRNPVDRPNENEIPILEAYEYNQKNDIQNESNIQKVADGKVLLFTKAISIPGGLCLNCHGEPLIDIHEETLKKINQLYPEDKARGHKLGDLRGMWSIAIPQKEVVNKM